MIVYRGLLPTYMYLCRGDPVSGHAVDSSIFIAAPARPLQIQPFHNDVIMKTKRLFKLNFFYIKVSTA